MISSEKVLPRPKGKVMKRKIRMDETGLKTNNFILRASLSKIQHEFLIDEEKEILNIRVDSERNELVVLVACRDTTSSLPSSHGR